MYSNTVGYSNPPGNLECSLRVEGELTAVLNWIAPSLYRTSYADIPANETVHALYQIRTIGPKGDPTVSSQLNVLHYEKSLYDEGDYVFEVTVSLPSGIGDKSATSKCKINTLDRGTYTCTTSYVARLACHRLPWKA